MSISSEKRRRRLRVLGILLGMVFTLLALAPAAQAQIGPCALISDPTAREVCENAQNIIAPLPGLVNQIADTSIVQPILEGIVRAEAEAVGAVLLKMYQYLNTNTAPELTASWFLQQYAIVLALSVFLAFFTGFGRLSVGVKDKDIGEVGKGSASILVFLVAAPTIPLIVMAIVQVTDGPATQIFMQTAGESLNTAIKNVSVALAKEDFGTAVLLPLFVLLLGALGGALTWIMLFFREAALYLFTAAEVVGLAMWVGGRLTNDMFRQTTWSLIGLMLFKPIMAFTLVIGVGLLGSGGGAEPVLMGATICLLVPVISWAAYKRIANHHINEGALLAKARVWALALATRRG